MNTIAKNNAIIELHYLEQPFSQLRQRSRAAYLRMSESIQRDTQLVPVICIPTDKQTWILIDGYLRVGALKNLGVDTVSAEVWVCDISTALILLMTQSQQRHWEAIEQARFLEVLHTECGLSQIQIAKNISRDVSWVSRRLALLKDLSEKAFAAYADGKISTWALSRVIQPLARANTLHADSLVDYLCGNFESTRALLEFFKTYQRSNKSVRQKMSDNPTLFFKTLAFKDSEKESQKLAAGPEGRWLRGIQLVFHKLQELKRLTATAFYPGQEQSEQTYLKKIFHDTQKIYHDFETTSRQHIDAITANQTDNFDPEIEGKIDSRN